MTKLRVWMAKKILKHIEWHERQVKVYTDKLNTHLKALSKEEHMLFCISTGYPESVLKTDLNESEEGD